MPAPHRTPCPLRVVRLLHIDNTWGDPPTAQGPESERLRGLRDEASRPWRYVVFKPIVAIVASCLQREIARAKPHVVQLSAHGNDDEIQFPAQRGGTTSLPRELVAEAFRLNAEHVDLVFLAACDSEDLARDIAEDVGLAIGCRGEVFAAAISAFMTGFYSALLVGETIQAAFEKGRHEVEIGHPGCGKFFVLVRGHGDASAEVSPFHCPLPSPWWLVLLALVFGLGGGAASYRSEVAVEVGEDCLVCVSQVPEDCKEGLLTFSTSMTLQDTPASNCVRPPKRDTPMHAIVSCSGDHYPTKRREFCDYPPGRVIRFGWTFHPPWSEP